MTTERRTRLYLTAAHLGALGAIAVLTAHGLNLPDFIKGLGMGVMILPLITLLFRSLRDEYIESLWRSGTSWAFVTVVGCVLFAPMAEGFIDGFTGAPKSEDFPPAVTGYAAIIAFFAGFHLRWLRGLR